MRNDHRSSRDTRDSRELSSRPHRDRHERSTRNPQGTYGSYQDEGQRYGYSTSNDSDSWSRYTGETDYGYGERSPNQGYRGEDYDYHIQMSPPHQDRSLDRSQWNRPRASGSSYQSGSGRETSYGLSSAFNKNERSDERPEGQFSGRGPKGYRRSDERVQEEVCETLSLSPRVDASEIEVDVKEGVVTLRGTVEERQMKRLAEDICEGISGVKDVRNEIRVSSSRTNSETGGVDYSGTGTMDTNSKKKNSSSNMGASRNNLLR